MTRGRCVPCKDDKCVPADIPDSNGCDLDDREDTHPVQEDADGLTAAANAGRAYFGRIEPGDGQPADAEEALEEEYHGCGAVGSASGSDR